MTERAGLDADNWCGIHQEYTDHSTVKCPERCSHCQGAQKVWSKNPQADGSYRAICSVCNGSGRRPNG